MADASEIRMNLAAIKRVDPYAKNIVDSTAHVAFYTFNSFENEWEKTDVEGAFFVYSRNAEPFHSIFINNRLNTTSFVEPITSHIELQSQPPFLLYRNERSRIRGFWFYSSVECDRIGELVTTLSQKCEIHNKLSASDKQNNANIFNMLTKAQQEFKNSQNAPNDNQNVASHNVLKFFASAKPAVISETQLLQRVFPKTLSVEQLEKQQRIKSPLGNNTTLAHALQKFNSNLDRKVPVLMDKASVSVNGGSEMQISSMSHFFSLASNTNSRDDLTDRRKSSSKFSLEGFPASESDSFKPELMPPTMFEKSIKVPSKTNIADEDLTVDEKPLNQTQFIQAFNYLVNHDSDFKKKLHEAYLKSIAL